MVVKSWKEHDQELMQEHGRVEPSYENPTSDIIDGEINALTIEMRSGNIIVRAVQPCLLLVLVGCNHIPHEVGDPRTQFHAEAKGDSRYPALQYNSNQVVFKDLKSLSPNEHLGEALGNEATEDEGRTTHSNVHQSQAENGDESNKDHLGPYAQSPLQISESSRNDDSSPDENDQAMAILALQRSKLDSMVGWLQKQLNERNFVFREDIS